MQVSLWEVLKRVSDRILIAKSIKRNAVKLDNIGLYNFAFGISKELRVLQQDLIKRFKDNVVEFDKNKDYNTCTCDTLVYDSVHNFNYCPACGTKIKWI